MSVRRDGAGGGKGRGDTSSARVPELRRYVRPRHFIVDELVKALK